jgi:hypothetical protein
MLIKSADDKTSDIDTLTSLAARPDVSSETRQRIEQEIRNIQAGVRGERDAAYEIDFIYKASNNWAVIHDLRIEHEGRVAQIDHLVINRMLEIWLCESKHFSEGVSINEHGEFSAFYGGKPRGVASPIEQNRKHASVLDALFRSHRIEIPNRLGFTITPKINCVVLISKNARISRPKTKVDRIDSIIKVDQLKVHIEKSMDSNPLSIGRVIGSDALEKIARSIAATHQPLSFNWAARFGVVDAPIQSTPVEATKPSEGEVDKSLGKLFCASCKANVSFAVAKFCWHHKSRFDGKVYCMECQSNFPK